MKTLSTSTELNQETSTTDLGVEPTTAADLGYDEPAETPTETPKEVPPAEPAKETPPVEAVTGYGKKDEPAAPPVEDKKDEPAEAPTDEVKEIETVVSTLGDSYDKKKITEFVTKHKLTKEQVTAYVEQIKADEAAETKAREERIASQRKEWNEELLKDPEFGGANFDKSIHEVESLIGNLFPNTKKVLTDKKGMLPPYFMKDLLAVAKALKPANQFVAGEPPAPSEEPTSFLDDMYT